MSDDKDAAMDLFLQNVKTHGAAVSTVSDGHVIMFDRKTLQALLDKDPDAPSMVIFIKKPDKN